MAPSACPSASLAPHVTRMRAQQLEGQRCRGFQRVNYFPQYQRMTHSLSRITLCGTVHLEFQAEGNTLTLM